MTSSLIIECRNRIAATEQLQKRLHRRIRWVGTLRFVLFLTALLSVGFYIAGNYYPVLLYVSAVCVVLFLLLVKYHTRLFTRYSQGEVELAVRRGDLFHLSEDYSHQEDGGVFVDASHDYAFDIDLFGPHSLYQMMNRTCSDLGARRLAELLGRHLIDVEKIHERQRLMRRMAKDEEFTTRFRIEMLGAAAEDFAANGRKRKESLLSLGGVSWQEWADLPDAFAGKWYYRVLTPVAFGLNLLVWGSAILGWLPYSLATLVTVSFAVVASVFTVRITRKQQEYARRLRTLSLVAPTVNLIEKVSWKDEAAWKEVSDKLDRGSVQASSAIRQLRSLMDALDRRNNVLLLFLLNGLFFWEIHQMIRLERWKRTNASCIPGWMDALALADAYVSMALFVRYRPTYTWPEVKEANGGFVYKATALSHPLMKCGTCVPNPIEMVGLPYFLVVTGANMAGKSTYLRTVSVNFLLACVGLPVCGEGVVLTPARLLTSLRTADSLSDGESYFFAELKRLKLIIESLKDGDRLFIVLDEILRGTNSVDKQKGSLALLKQLVRLQANGIIATHDLLLGTLAEHHPAHVCNLCFEADIRGDELSFSYRLRPGLAQNMNACFLMQRMGIGEGEW